jgi:uncharacterized protein
MKRRQARHKPAAPQGSPMSDPDAESNDVDLRRRLIYLERSIEEGIRWATFEPNNDALWARIRTTIADRLTHEWRRGALVGTKADEAFFVKCDRTTMTQEDIDNGRLLIEIGVAPVTPAEFVIIRIGQWTADRKHDD